MTTAKKRRRAPSGSDYGGAVSGPGWVNYDYDPVPADITSAMEALGIEIAEENSVEVYSYCPGHPFLVGKEDRHPTTWSVNKETGTHFCFACGYQGSFVGLVWDHLSGFYGLGDDDGHGDASVTWDQAREWVEDQGVDLDMAVEIEGRGFRSDGRKRRESNLVIPDDILDNFSWPPTSALEDRGISLRSAKAYGVRFDRSNREWIFPVRDPKTGDLWGWQTKPIDKRRKPRNYPDEKGALKKSETLFGIDRMPRNCIPVMIEAPVDCCCVFDAFEGKTYWGVGTLGAIVSDAQMRLVLDVTDEVVVALDNDAEGKKHSERLRDSWGTRINMSFINYGLLRSYRKDPGEMSNKELRQSLLSTVHSTAYVAV